MGPRDCKRNGLEWATGRPLTDLERLLVGAVFVPVRGVGNALFAFQAELFGQICPQTSAGLNVQGLVDRLVAHLHSLIIAKVERQH